MFLRKLLLTKSDHHNSTNIDQPDLVLSVSWEVTSTFMTPLRRAQELLNTTNRLLLRVITPVSAAPQLVERSNAMMKLCGPSGKLLLPTKSTPLSRQIGDSIPLPRVMFLVRL